MFYADFMLDGQKNGGNIVHSGGFKCYCCVWTETRVFLCLTTRFYSLLLFLTPYDLSLLFLDV